MTHLPQTTRIEIASRMPITIRKTGCRDPFSQVIVGMIMADLEPREARIDQQYLEEVPLLGGYLAGETHRSKAELGLGGHGCCGPNSLPVLWQRQSIVPCVSAGTY